MAFGMLPVKCNTNSKVQSIKLSTPNLIIDLGCHFTFIVGTRIINLEPIPQQLEMIIELDIDLLQKIEPGPDLRSSCVDMKGTVYASVIIDLRVYISI